MSHSQKPKRKPQITGQLWNEKGDHLYIIFNMGFGDSRWADIMSKAIISSALDIQPRSWIMFRISYEKEVAFTKFLERIFKRQDTPSEYLVVRTKSDEADIDSWFFIHNLSIDVIADKAHRYSAGMPQVINSDELEKLLKNLFKVDMHPEKKRLHRWSASTTMLRKLRVLRMRHLVELARTGKKHELIDYDAGRFESQLARYVRHDTPLICNLNLREIFLVLREVIKLNAITRYEVLEVITQLLKEGGKFGLVDMYAGLPKHGAEMDRQNGRYEVREGKHSAISFRKGGATPEELAWELIHHLEPPDDEKYLE